MTWGPRRSVSTPSRPDRSRRWRPRQWGISRTWPGCTWLSSPLGRNITREEVGSAGMFLLSDLASGITGEIIHVDCGYSVMGSPGRAIESCQGKRLKSRREPDLRPWCNRVIDRLRDRNADPGRHRPDPPGRLLPGPQAPGNRPSTPGTGNFPAASASPASFPQQPAARECLEETGLTRRRRPAAGASRCTGILTVSSSCISTTARPKEQAPSRPPDSASAGSPRRELPALRFPEANEAIVQELAQEAGDAASKSPPLAGSHLCAALPNHGIGFGFRGIGGSRSTTLSISP